MTRQSFNDFLGSGSPGGFSYTSSPRGGRGRGRGGAMQGPDSGPSTPRGGGRGRGGGRANYSNVAPIDYDAINKQTYRKLDVSAPSPYDRTSTPSRGRGRGSAPTPSRSGSATPHEGLGFHDPSSSRRNNHPLAGGAFAAATRGRGGAKLKGILDELELEDNRKRGIGSFVAGRGGKSKKAFDAIPLGAGTLGAPIFVKSGVVRPEDFEIEDSQVLGQPSRASPPKSAPPNAASDDGQDEDMEAVDDSLQVTEVEVAQSITLESLQTDRLFASMATAIDRVSISARDDANLAVSTRPAPVEEDIEIATDDKDLFFVDTTPQHAEQAPPIFDVHNESGVIGDQTVSDEEEEEEIVFVPRTFAKPEPIELPASSARPEAHLANQSRSFLPVDTPASRRKEKKAAAKQKKKERKMGRKERREERNRKSEGLRARPDMDGSDIDWGSAGEPDKTNAPGEDPEDDEEGGLAILREHLQVSISAPTHNAVAADDDDDDEDVAKEEDYDIQALAAFAQGMGAGQVTIDDINDEREIDEEDDEEAGWIDTSGSELSDDDEAPLAEDGQELVADDREVIEIGSSSDDDNDAQAILSDDSDVEELFNGKDAWAVEADKYIDSIERALDENAHLLKNKNRAARTGVWNAIEQGDFGDDLPDAPAPKGKKNKLQGIPAELQGQWETDRQRKAEKKRQREMDRLEAAMSLYPASKKGKAAAKKAAKKGKWQMDQMPSLSAGALADMFSDMESDELESDFDADVDRHGEARRRKGFRPVTDMYSLNDEIRAFIRDRGKTTMTLQPMEKFNRKMVHELAICYGLKSQSKGKGHGRFPILVKTQRTSYEIADLRKVDRILSRGPRTDAFKGGFGGKGKGGKREKLPGSAGRAGGEVRHRDGDAVGGGAAAIGQDNIGHRLLSKMGWTEGTRIGMSGGLEAPIVAIVKNSKLGLGA